MKIKIGKKQIPFFVLVLFGILIFMMGILNHYYFKTFTYDYGNYNFAFWDYSHFRISPVPLFNDINFLQDHFSLTLMYFVPVYWLLNWLTQTYTLIIIQCSIIVIAGWYSYEIIRLKSKNLWLAVGVLVYYFTLLGRYTSFTGDVNLAIISACFIPIFLYYFETQKYVIAYIILILSLFSRENIPIWFVFIFIVLVIQNWKDKKSVFFSLIGILTSIVYFIVLFKFIIPSLESPDKHYSLFNYSALGANPGEALTFILKHPIDTLKLLFENNYGNPVYNGVKVEFYWVYFISGGIILLLRPQYLIWFIPIVAQKVLNDNPIRWGIASYYSIEVVTLLPLSVFLVLSTIKQKMLQNSLIVAVCIAAFSMTLHKLDVQNCRVPWSMNPPKEKFYDMRFYKRPFNIAKVNKLLSLIPPEAKVSASNMFLPHLAQRPFIYYFPNIQDADYILLSVFDHFYMQTLYENEICRLKYLSDPKWEVVAAEYPVFLLRLNEHPTSDKSALNMLWSYSDTLFCNYEKIDSINGQILFSNGQIADNLKNLTQNKSHSFNNGIMLPSKDSHSSPLKIEEKEQINHIQISIWCYSNVDEGYIVVSGSNNFYKECFESDSTDSSGWRRLVSSFWVPFDYDGSAFNIQLSNNSLNPIYFDDLQIIKSYRK
jgi:uncharacterized membrane protein